MADTIQDLIARANEHARIVSCFQPLDMGMLEFNALQKVSELALYRALALDEENEEFPEFLAETAALISEEDGGEVIYETASSFDRRILTSGINISLFDAIKRNPEKVYKMTPREFEEFVAEVFFRRGFEVRLTPQSNDGGHDIVAVWNNDLTGKEVHLVECKRYAAEKKISVGIVRGLHGVVHDANATKGILVTTSGFSKQARDFEQRHRGRIKLQDYDALLGWIRALK